MPPAWLNLLVEYQTRKQPRTRATYARRDRPSRKVLPEMTYDQARAILATMLEHPLVEWAC